MNKTDKTKAYTVSGEEAILIASEPLDNDNTYDFARGVKIEHGMGVVVTEDRLKEIQNNQYITDKFTLDIKKFSETLWEVEFKDKSVVDDDNVEGILMMLA